MLEQLHKPKTHKMALFLLFILCFLTVVCLHFNYSWKNWIDKNASCTYAHKENKTTAGSFVEFVNRNTGAQAHAKECPMSPPSLMEQTRRHISQTAHYQGIFLRNQIHILQRELITNFTSLRRRRKYKNMLENLLAHTLDFNRVLELEIEKLATFDGWNNWRKEEVLKLRKIVSDRLTKLQNPNNCSKTQVLVCNLTNTHGFASGVHDVLWCFIKAYSEQKRLVLETSHWHYAPHGWNTLFRPVSETCPTHQSEVQGVSPWPGKNDDIARGLLRTLPQDLGSKIIRLHGNPLAWWYGQFVSYLMRPNHQLQSSINAALENIKFSKGIVGIHVRRTDKIRKEAKAYKLEEYMELVEDYFQKLELISLENVKRRVYIATDEPNVIKECRIRYPHYECLFNPESAEIASSIKTRYTNESLWYLLIDIFALAQTDYVVCTLSSGMCRLVYELKHGLDDNSADVSDTVSSLDVLHHYARVTPGSREAIYNHNSLSLQELPFSRADVFGYENAFSPQTAAKKGEMFNGFINMKDHIRYRQGLVPIYKTREMFELEKFPLLQNENV